MTDWITLPPPTDGGAQPQQGFVPTIDVPAHGPHGYDPSVAPGGFGSEQAPSLVGGPGAQKDGGPTTHWVVTPPTPEGSTGPAAAPAPPMPVPPIPPQQPPPPQMMPVPMMPAPGPSPQQPQQAPQQPQMPPQTAQRFIPGQVPPELQPAQAPPQAPAPAQLQPTIPQQQGPPGGPTWGHTAGLMTAKALEGLPMMGAGVLDLPQVVGGGLYHYFTDQPTIAPAQAQMRAPPELGGGQMQPQGQPPAQPPPAPGDDENAPFFARQVERAYRYLGGPEPQSENEQTLAALAETAGATGASLLTGNVLGATGRLAKLAQTLKARPIEQVLSGTAGAAAGEYARRTGGGSGAQFAAALLGSMGSPIAWHGTMGVLRGGRAAFLSPQQIAARQFATSAADPGALQARLRAGTVSPLGAPQTSATATMDPGLARLEAAQRSTPAGVGIVQVEAERAKAFADTLQGMHPSTGATEQQRGEAIRTHLGSHNDTMRADVDRRYTAARGVGGTYDISGAQARLDAIARKYYGPGGDPTPRIFQSVAQDIARRGGRASNEVLINMDRRLGNAANKAANTGDRTQAAALREAQKMLEGIHGSPELQSAKAARARQGSVMGRDAGGSNTVGRIVAEENGRPKMTGEQVAKTSVATRAGVQQILDAGAEALRAARASGASASEINAIHAQRAHTVQMMREQFLDNGMEAAKTAGGAGIGGGATVPHYSSANWQRFWAKNDDVAKLLFRPDQYRDLRLATQQMADDATVTAMASAKGSHTVQHAAHLMKGDPSIAAIISAASRGQRGGGAVAARVLQELPAIVATVGGVAAEGLHGGMWGILGHTVGKPFMEGLMENRAELVQAALQEMMADPAKARLYLSKGNAVNFAKMLHASKASNGPMWNLVRRLVPAVASTEVGSTAYLPAAPNQAPAQ